MTNDDDLRGALRRAVAGQPLGGDRAGAALTLAGRRRQQRTVAVSCVAAIAMAVVTVTARGGDPTGLRPRPANSGNATTTPSPDPSPDGSPTPTGTASPAAGTSPDESPAPVPSGTRSEAPDATPPFPGPPSRPPSRPRLDVFVLLDASASMVSARTSLPAALERLRARLARAGVNTTWGLGLYRDAQYDVGSGLPPAYELVQRVGGYRAPDVDAAEFRGGGPSVPEAATMALDASVDVGHVPHTPPDQGAGFREGVPRLILLVTDAPTHEGGDHPTIEEAVARMVAHDVHVAAWHVLDNNPTEPTREHLDQLASGTGGVTRRAVDCGSPATSLAPGDALVCAYPAASTWYVDGFAAALANLAGNWTP